MYPEQFIIEMRQLLFAKQCLFGLSQTERILHFYESFEQEWEVDQPYTFMVEALEQGYQYMTSPSVAALSNLKALLPEVEKGIPDNDEYRGGSEVTLGQNAAIALLCSLEFIIDKDVEALEEAVGKTVDTVDNVVLDRSEDENMDTQPNIDKEIALQLDFMEYIANMELSPTGIQSLRTLSQQNRIIA